MNKSEIHSLPPHNLEAEAGVLGSILLDFQTGMAQASDRLRAGAAMFYDNRHQHIYRAYLSLYENRIGGDLITVGNRLRDVGVLEEIGGIAFLAELEDATPFATNLPHYLNILVETFTLRRLQAACVETMELIKGNPSSVPAFVNEATRKLLAASETDGGSSAKKLGSAFRELIAEIESATRGRKVMQGLPTGFNFLDNILCGLKPAEYIIIAGRPGGGKTMLAMQIAEHISVDQKTPVGVFSMEMTLKSLAQRALFSRAGADQQKYRNGFPLADDIPKLLGAVEEMTKAPWYVDEIMGLTPETLAVRARRMVHDHGVKLIIIDYLQLMRGREGKRYDGRAQELADVSMEIMRLKKELNIPFLVLAQMNREIEKDPKRKPVLSDLKDTGQTEQDADVVMFLYDVNMKKALEDPDSDDGKAALAWLESDSVQKLPKAMRGTDWDKHLRRMNCLVAKQRNGPAGVDAALVMVKPWVRFVDAYTPERRAGGNEDFSDGSPVPTELI
jgi:replicative DNA helicase